MATLDVATFILALLLAFGFGVYVGVFIVRIRE